MCGNSASQCAEGGQGGLEKVEERSVPAELRSGALRMVLEGAGAEAPGRC